MSVLRIARPGHPTTLIDQGPAEHVTRKPNGGSVIGGVYVVPVLTHGNDARREQLRLAAQRYRGKA